MHIYSVPKLILYFNVCHPSGVIRQVKPIVGPRELVLEVTMNYVQSGVISQQNIVIIHVFISEFWFWKREFPGGATSDVFWTVLVFKTQEMSKTIYSNDPLGKFFLVFYSGC